MKRCLCKHEKGLTLVEVLAALVILGIFFIGILTILPQMTLFNARTETKLDTMNLARQEMATILSNEAWTKQLQASTENPALMEPDFLSPVRIQSGMESESLGYSKNEAGSLESEPISAESFVQYEKTDEYKFVTDIYLQCQPYLASAQPTTGGGAKVPCLEQDTVKLYALHLKVYTDDGTASGTYRLSSETFSYIPYTAIPPAVESAGE